METLALALGVCCVLLVRCGQMLFQIGVARSKNAASPAIRLTCDFAVSTLAFWAVGGAILLHDQNGYLGFKPGLLFSDSTEVLCYLCLLLSATGLVSGAIGERSRFAVVAPLSLLVSLVLFPVIGHWAWWGFLDAHGAMDVGGAISLLIPVSVVALVAARAVGPRSGKYNRDGSCNAIPGHSVTLMATGSMLLLAGWVAYMVLATHVGSKADGWKAAFDVVLASAAGTASAMFYCTWRFGKPDVALAFVGLISGAVGVSAGAAFLPAWAAALLGALCGVVGPWFSIWTDIRLRIDDATGLSTAVGASAVVSVIGGALLVPNTLSMRLVALGMNAAGIVLAVLLSAGLALGLMAVLKKRMKLRVSEADEYDGLDLAEHDVNAYPDFQQTMIKSHHLRQA